MRIIKTIFLWTFLALILQLAGYFYLDQFYLAGDLNYKEVKVDTSGRIVSKENIFLPYRAERISFSHDGKYVSFQEGGRLQTIDTTTGQNREVTWPQAEEIAYYKWLPDRDRMIVVAKSPDTNGSGYLLQFFSYDADRNEKIMIYGDNGEILQFPLADNEAKVDDIALSTLTHTMYCKIRDRWNNDSLYSINVMNQVSQIRTISNKIGNLFVIPHEVRTVYEVLNRGQVWVSRSGSLNIPGIDKPSLIGVDQDDNIYIGGMENERIKIILFGKYDSPLEDWQTIALPYDVPKQDIYLTNSGKVYLDRGQQVTNLLTGKTSSYQGQLLQIGDGWLASLKDGRLVKIYLP